MWCIKWEGQVNKGRGLGVLLHAAHGALAPHSLDHPYKTSQQRQLLKRKQLTQLWGGPTGAGLPWWWGLGIMGNRICRGKEGGALVVGGREPLCCVALKVRCRKDAAQRGRVPRTPASQSHAPHNPPLALSKRPTHPTPMHLEAPHYTHTPTCTRRIWNLRSTM